MENDFKAKIIEKANSLQHEQASDIDEKRKNREKSARQWAEHFFQVLEFVKTLDDSEEISIDNLTRLLADHWEAKEHDKNIELKRSVEALRKL